MKITGARRGTFRHAALARLHARWIRWAQARLKTVRDLYWPELYTMPVGWSWRSRDDAMPLHRWLWEKGGSPETHPGPREKTGDHSATAEDV